ncbi:MAG: DUF5688 family protein [Eubacteriales bacterium]|nr:DUF5688 family protein [Eubacteriales bacterium]
MKSYQEFLDYIKNNIKDYLPEKYSNALVDIHPCLKNNGRMLDGLSIQLKEEKATPIIYLNSFYSDYENGKSLSSILSSVAVARDHFAEPRLSTSIDSLQDYLHSPEAINHIYFQICGSDTNTDLLNNMPHKIEKDLALTYHLEVGNSYDSNYSIKITNDLMKMLDLTPEELHSLAMENTPRDYPPVFCDINTALDSLLGVPSEENYLGSAKEFKDTNEPSMYLLTNKTKTLGSAALFYPDVPERLAQMLHNDFYILPSSVHEMLIIPDSPDIKPESLFNMVDEVNTTCVDSNDYLATNVYHYDKTTGELTSYLEEKEQQLAQEKKPSILAKLQTAKDSVLDNKMNSTPKHSLGKDAAPEL